MNIFVKSLIGPNGGISSTRINVYVFVVILAVSCIVNLVTGRVLAPALLDNIMIAMLGFAGFKTIDGGLKMNKDIKIAEKDTKDINIVTNKTNELTQVNVVDEKQKNE